jgi:hypothetical protein
MTALSALWLPILLSAVAVFLVSSIIHMGPFWHRTDYPRIPKEDAVMEALRPLAIPPGDYMVPRPSSHADMKNPEFLEKMRKGPVMVVTFLRPGEMGMGRPLILWFLYGVVVSAFAAWVTGRALPPAAEFMRVFCFAAVTAFLGYAAALWQMWIWYHRSLSMTIKSTFDGVIYALVTAGIFGWLWPAMV